MVKNTDNNGKFNTVLTEFTVETKRAPNADSSCE